MRGSDYCLQQDQRLSLPVTELSWIAHWQKQGGEAGPPVTMPGQSQLFTSSHCQSLPVTASYCLSSRPAGSMLARELLPWSSVM